ncbi:hypothetical protein G3M48_006128 [Beauveria asiatica]|uniref:Uncharacterized protein n=1 Tax=Beauveria asiatica TaxID=1069075 RepID=A0AAW0RQ65_9HYPO
MNTVATLLAAAGGVTWTGTVTDLGSTLARESPVTRTPLARESVEAEGIKLISVASGSIAISITTLSHIALQTLQLARAHLEEPSSALLGSIAGVVLLAVGASLLYCRKKSGPTTSTSSLMLQKRAPNPRTFSYQPQITNPTQHGGNTCIRPGRLNIPTQ